jgi:hypothetical protein
VVTTAIFKDNETVISIPITTEKIRAACHFAQQGTNQHSLTTPVTPISEVVQYILNGVLTDYLK